MKQINLWRVRQDGDARLAAEPVSSLHETRTERDLEDLLVSSPEILLPGLLLVGRQTQTDGGPLDLLGVDQDGKLIVFELKRGTLTREAVAQIVDYASYLHDLDHDQLCRHIEERSGGGGVPKIDDFARWHSEQFPGAADQLDERPRMMLVGLGADDRVRRMTEFMASGGLDISLVTFHAFALDGQTLVARQTEVASRSDGSPVQQRATKQSNWEALRKNMQAAGVTELFEAMRRAVSAELPSSQWPNRSTYAFMLPGRTESGNPTYRVYVSLVVDIKRPNQVGIAFLERASQLIAEQLSAFRDEVRGELAVEEYWSGYCTWLTQQDWDRHESRVRELVAALADCYQNEAKSEQVTEPEAAS